MTLLLPMVAALSAILLLPGWSFFFDVVPKVVVILIGAALVFLPRGWVGVGETTARPLRYFGIIAAAQAMVIVIATIFSTHRELSVIGSTWRRSGAIAEIAVLVLAVAGAGKLAANRERLRVLLRITVLASIPISIYGILQYFGIDPLLAAAGYHFGEGRYMIVRPPSTLGHAAYFATYLLYAAFGGSELVRIEEERVWKVAAIAACVLAMFAIVLSGTRAALLGFVVGAVFVVFRERFSLQGLVAAATAIVLIGVMIGGFYFSPAGERLRARAFWASEDRLGGSRMLLWRDSLHMSSSHLLLGFGPETFAIEFPLHQSLDLARAFPDFYHESPHNIFIDALVSKGVFGLAGLVALTALCLAYARGPIGGAFVAMLVSQQFTTFTLTTELYFYLAAALIIGTVETPALAPGTQPPAASSRLSGKWWPGRIILSLPFIGLAVYLATGDALLATARRALDHNDPDRAAAFEERAREWHMTADVYFSRRFFDWAPVDSRKAPVGSASKAPLVRFRAWQGAMASASHAAETADDRQNALVNLAALQSPSGDAASVERTLRKAVAAAPMWYKPHWLLAQVLALEGRTADAQMEAQAAFDRDGGKHAEVTALRDRLRGQ
jgi:O-antigen ligase